MLVLSSLVVDPSGVGSKMVGPRFPVGFTHGYPSYSPSGNHVGAPKGRRPWRPERLICMHPAFRPAADLERSFFTIGHFLGQTLSRNASSPTPEFVCLPLIRRFSDSLSPINGNLRDSLTFAAVKEKTFLKTESVQVSCDRDIVPAIPLDQVHLPFSEPSGSVQAVAGFFPP
jgi:hypothetical protein